jgi:predicted component of type VI protein secretion system
MRTMRLHIGQGIAQTTLSFDQLPVNIGRDTTNDCCLDFAFVSRFHARLELRDGRLLLCDRGSRQGTWIRGCDRLQPKDPVDLLAVGSEFRIGPLRIRVELPEEGGTQRLEPEPVEHRVETIDVSARPVAFGAAHALAAAPPPTPAPAVSSEHALQRALNVFKVACTELAAAARLAVATNPGSLTAVATQVEAATVPLRAVVSSTPSRADSTQRLVLDHVQQLAVRCAPESGAPRSPEATVAFLKRLERVLTALLDGFVALRFAYGCEVEGDTSAHPASRSGLAAQLLGWNSDDASLDCLHRDLGQLVTQHTRLSHEAKRGLDHLFAAFDPSAIERACDLASPWHPIRSRVRWSEFVRRFQMLDQERRRERLLGPTFASMVRALGASSVAPPRGRSARGMTLRLAAA